VVVRKWVLSRAEKENNEEREKKSAKKENK
jgi:hypothetical protein